MDNSAEKPHDYAGLLAFEQRKALMRDLVFGLALESPERPPLAGGAAQK